MFKTNAITLDFKSVDRPRTKADFTYQISPATIEIVDTGRGKLSVADDLDAVMRRIEYWHMGSLTGFKITYRDQTGVRHEVEWDGQRALVSPADGAASKR
jgi:YD repeat-containing protein